MTMSKRERLEAAFRGEAVDRVPVALWRHWPGDDQRAEDLAAAHLAFQKQYDFDFIKVTPTSSFCLEDWGVETRYWGNIEGTREYVRRPVQSLDDWGSLPVLDPQQGKLGQQLQCLRLIADGAGQAPFIQTIFNPLAQAARLVGERFIVHLRQHPEAVHAGLETITQTTVRFVEAVRETGAAGIFFATQHATHQQMSRAEYEEFGRPYDLRILEAAQVEPFWFNLLHIHGYDIMFDLLSDYPAQVVNWHDRETPPSLAEAQGRFSGAVCGGIDRWKAMLRGDPSEVRAQVADAIAQTGSRRLIVGTGCVTFITSPTANIRAAREVVES
jgi:uroporphyrinogen decarboxylase